MPKSRVPVGKCAACAHFAWDKAPHWYPDDASYTPHSGWCAIALPYPLRPTVARFDANKRINNPHTTGCHLFMMGGGPPDGNGPPDGDK